MNTGYNTMNTRTPWTVTINILWMALFSWIPIFVDWTKLRNPRDSKFVATVFSFIIHTDIYYFVDNWIQWSDRPQNQWKLVPRKLKPNTAILHFKTWFVLLFIFVICDPILTSDWHLHATIAFAVYGYGTLANIICCVCSLGGAVILPCAKRHRTTYHVVLSIFMGLAVGTLASDALLHLIPAVSYGVVDLLFKNKIFYGFILSLECLSHCPASDVLPSVVSTNMMKYHLKVAFKLSHLLDSFKPPLYGKPMWTKIGIF